MTLAQAETGKSHVTNGIVNCSIDLCCARILFTHLACFNYRENMSSGTFESDINFCPECGSILPLPGAASTVTCYSCKYQIDVKGKVPYTPNLTQSQRCNDTTGIDFIENSGNKQVVQTRFGR